MRYFLGFAVSCFLYFPTFAQSSQTVTLVFVTPPNDNVRNYEAVIDDVSYYSENNSSSNAQERSNSSSINRNTIYLNNFQAGRHSIQVYSLRNGSNEERNSNSPVYSSAFNVREGFDTKIAIRGNGQVQFSERQSAFNNSTDNNVQKNNYDVRRDENTFPGNNTGRDNNNDVDNNQTGSGANGNKNITGNNIGDDPSRANTATSDNGSYSQSRDVNKRSATKRNDTFAKDDDRPSTTEDANQNNRVNADPNESGNRNFDHEKSNDQIINNGSGRKSARINSNPPMADYQFNYLYETLGKQWLPGQKMKSINNEFANSGDNFTTMQAAKLIALVTEEGNRLQLAKSAYHTITDPENFSQVFDLLKLESSREELDKFIENFQDQ